MPSITEVDQSLTFLLERHAIYKELYEISDTAEDKKCYQSIMKELALIITKIKGK